MTDSFGALSQSLGSTSSSLIERVKTRDEQAWRRLVHLYGPLVGFWVRRAGLQSADAHDVFQQVFLAVAQGIEHFQRDRPGDSFRGWLRVITRNKLMDHFRRQGAEPAGVGGSEALQRLAGLASPTESLPDDAEDEAHHQLRLRAMGLIQDEFEPKTWEMFWRVTVGGQAAKDVAVDLGVTPSTVRVAKSRVLRRLREELESLEGF